MTAPRKIGEVIERILAVVPEDETDLRAAINKAAERAWFTAPEAMRRCWGQLALALSDHLPQIPATDWQVKVGRIIRAEE